MITNNCHMTTRITSLPSFRCKWLLYGHSNHCYWRCYRRNCPSSLLIMHQRVLPMRGMEEAAGGVDSASSRSSTKKATKMFIPGKRVKGHHHGYSRGTHLRQPGVLAHLEPFLQAIPEAARKAPGSMKTVEHRAR